MNSISISKYIQICEGEMFVGLIGHLAIRNFTNLVFTFMGESADGARFDMKIVDFCTKYQTKLVGIAWILTKLKCLFNRTPSS